MTPEVPPIEKSCEIPSKFPSVVERYFTKKDVTGLTGPGDDYCILVHSNKVHLLTLAPTHSLIASKKTPCKVDFKVSERLDRLSNSVQGKLKKGAQHLEPTSVVMFVECEDGSKFVVRSGVKGKLLEVNEYLLKNPKALIEEPQGRGHVAFILPAYSRYNPDTDRDFDTGDS